MIVALLCIVGGFLDTVDVWEVNRYRCPDSGKVILVQHVWWSMDSEIGDYVVREWRMEKDVHCVPERIGDRWIGCFHDRKDKVQRTITARIYLETETTVDHEQADRNRRPQHLRRWLSR